MLREPVGRALAVRDALISAREPSIDAPAERAAVHRQRFMEQPQAPADPGRRSRRVREPPGVHRGAARHGSCDQPCPVGVRAVLDYRRDGYQIPRPGQACGLAGKIDLRGARRHPLGVPRGATTVLEPERQSAELVAPNRRNRVVAGERGDDVGDRHLAGRDLGDGRTGHGPTLNTAEDRQRNGTMQTHCR